MTKQDFEGVESVRVMRANRSLTIAGAAQLAVRMGEYREPEMRRTGSTAELYFDLDAELDVPPGVAVEIVECAGHLEVEEFAGNLAIGDVRGHFSATGSGSIAIRGNIGGRCHVEGAAAIAGKYVRGDLMVERAQSVSFDLVGGHATCMEVTGEVAIEQIGGHCHVEDVGGGLRALTVGGKLEAGRVVSLKVDTLGGKLRAIETSGEVAVGCVGGKVSIDGAGGVAIGTVGGQASLRGIRGNVEIAQVGGAARLAGDFAPGSNWHLKAGGRIIAELRKAASVEIDARARYGRVRVYGIEGEMRYAGRDNLRGRVGAGECKLKLETTGSDIIIEGEDARGHGSHGSHFQWRDLGTPFENLATNLGGEIPEMVAEIVGAAGRIVSESGSLSGGLVRGVTRTVGDAMREVEREIGELSEQIPEQAGEKLAKLAGHVRDLVDEAVADRKGRSRAEAERIRERIRQEALRMREAIRAARRARANRGTGEPPDEPAHKSEPQRPAESTSSSEDASATRPLAPDQEILRILAGVRSGEIAPEEADDLIRALMEVERAEGGSKPAA